jgi:hypothetical protein
MVVVDLLERAAVLSELGSLAHLSRRREVDLHGVVDHIEAGDRCAARVAGRRGTALRY